MSAAYARFVAAAEACGSTAVDEENAILSALGLSSPLLPAAGSDAYWDFLRSQTEQAQDEHDREIAAGRESTES